MKMFKILMWVFAIISLILMIVSFHFYRVEDYRKNITAYIATISAGLMFIFSVCNNLLN